MATRPTIWMEHSLVCLLGFASELEAATPQGSPAPEKHSRGAQLTKTTQASLIEFYQILKAKAPLFARFRDLFCARRDYAPGVESPSS